MFSKPKTSVLLTALGISAIFLGARASEAKVFLSLPEAVALAFPKPGCQVTTETRYLTDAEVKRAHELSGVDAVPSALIVRYVATCANQPGGRAYTDTHRVRTHPESLFIVIDPSGQLRTVEVLSFDEPIEYMPRPEWYGTFKQAQLNKELQVREKIPFVTGASLTSQATLQATRRTLALDQVLSAPAKIK